MEGKNARSSPELKPRLANRGRHTRIRDRKYVDISSERVRLNHVGGMRRALPEDARTSNRISSGGRWRIVQGSFSLRY